MAFIEENWYVFVAIIAVIVVIAAAIIAFIKLPLSTQLAALKEWLKYAVTEAEKLFKSGTGQLKLRWVYERFIETFTWLSKFISFEKFSGFVDTALVWLKNQLSSNKAIQEYVDEDEE